MLKQCAIMMSQLKETWVGMNNLRAKIILPSSILQREILLMVEKMPREPNELSFPPLFPLNFERPSLKKNKQKNPHLGNMQVSGRTCFIHISKSIWHVKCLCSWKKVGYREWMDLWIKSKAKTGAVWCGHLQINLPKTLPAKELL